MTAREESGAPREPLLSDAIKQPHMLWWVAAVPQLVLLLINVRAFWLVSRELEAWQRAMALWIAAFEIGLLIGCVALTDLLRSWRRNIPWLLCWPLLMAAMAYLWLVTAQLSGSLVPASVSVWILPPEQLLYYEFALMMPLIFYAVVRLACVELRMTAGVEI